MTRLALFFFFLVGPEEAGETCAGGPRSVSNWTVPVGQDSPCAFSQMDDWVMNLELPRLTFPAAEFPCAARDGDSTRA